MTVLRRLAHRSIDAAERDLGAPLGYLRRIADVSLSAFVKVGLFAPLAHHRKALPPAPYHLARIAATRLEDCGTCVQIEVNSALEAGVEKAWVRSAAEGRADGLPAELAEVVRFAEAVARQVDDPALREALRARWGDAGLVELALGVATARVFPATKRALGYATACSLAPVSYE